MANVPTLFRHRCNTIASLLVLPLLAVATAVAILQRSRCNHCCSPLRKLFLKVKYRQNKVKSHCNGAVDYPLQSSYSIHLPNDTIEKTARVIKINEEMIRIESDTVNGLTDI